MLLVFFDHRTPWKSEEIIAFLQKNRQIIQNYWHVFQFQYNSIDTPPTEYPDLSLVIPYDKKNPQWKCVYFLNSLI